MPTSRSSAHVPFQDVIHNKYYFLHFSGMMVFLAKRLMAGLKMAFCQKNLEDFYFSQLCKKYSSLLS